MPRVWRRWPSGVGRSCASGGPSAGPWPTAWRRPGTSCSPSPACHQANGSRPAPQMRLSACTRSSSGGSRPKPSCPRRKQPPCCSGRCSPRARSPCERSTAGRRSPKSRPTHPLTSRPEPIPSPRRRTRRNQFQHRSRRHRWGPQFVKEGETIRFFVTLEPRFQRLAERHLAELVSEGAVPAEYEAGAVMMTGAGRVRGMIGAGGWWQRQFNAAVKSTGQPGSTAKLPLLVAACEAGRKPESRVIDLPITATWPSNGALGYKGETTLREAFASSRNAAAVRLTQELGVRKVAEVSRRIGIKPGPEPDAGFVLGPFSTNVLSMTAAYAAVANGGYRVTPTGVLAVVDGRGQVRASFMEPARTRVIPERCIEPTSAVLNEVVRSGTGQG